MNNVLRILKCGHFGLAQSIPAAGAETPGTAPGKGTPGESETATNTPAPDETQDVKRNVESIPFRGTEEAANEVPAASPDKEGGNKRSVPADSSPAAGKTKKQRKESYDADRNAASAGQEPSERAAPREELVGKRVRVWWPAERAFFAGKVESFDADRLRHRVSYDDGDEEWLNMAKERWEESSGDGDCPPDDAHAPRGAKRSTNRAAKRARKATIEVRNQERSGEGLAEGLEGGLCNGVKRPLLPRATWMRNIRLLPRAACVQDERKRVAHITAHAERRGHGVGERVGARR